ncbi:hypothetical protein CBR_g40800 [Chara braunii]|uniref:26S proteasome regulatory subunit RPN7 n=1 Tax=Chara braunii TaxID=69332 RepID=A0A388LUJ1_CHABU|nr:hypothetical protein CBR_g40800 [Chara braunii]|eukprot:GBG85988.1 hypothetical protein CBR_g40800 [Chara braunii]
MEEGGQMDPKLEFSQTLFALRLRLRRSPVMENDDGVIDELRQQVLDAIDRDLMISVYQSCCEEFGWKPDPSHLSRYGARIAEEIQRLDDKIKDAEDNLGESEVREAFLEKALFFVRIADKEKALEALKATEAKTVAIGQKIDLIFHILRIGFFCADFDLISKNLDKAKSLFHGEGGDWERKNRLKVYEGLFFMATRNFKKAANLFLDSISTFTSYELLPYTTFIFYTVLTSIVSLDRVALKSKVVDAPEILAVIRDVPHLSDFLNALYNCDYRTFFVAFAALAEAIRKDRYLNPHFRFYLREARVVAYAQFLESYKSVTMEAMAKAFGVSVEFFDAELARFIASGRVNCKIDKVAGIISETNRPDAKNALYHATIKQGDVLLNRLQRLSRVIDM